MERSRANGRLSLITLFGCSVLRLVVEMSFLDVLFLISDLYLSNPDFLFQVFNDR